MVKFVWSLFGWIAVFVLTLVLIDVFRKLGLDEQIISGLLSGGIAGGLTFAGVWLTINNQQRRELKAKEEERTLRMPRVHFGCKSLVYKETNIKQSNRIITVKRTLKERMDIEQDPQALRVPLVLYVNNIGKTEITRVGISLILLRGETADDLEEIFEVEEVWFDLRRFLQRGETYELVIEDFYMVEPLTPTGLNDDETLIGRVLYHMALDLYLEDEFNDRFQSNGLYTNRVSYISYVDRSKEEIGPFTNVDDEDMNHLARITMSNLFSK